MEDEVAYKASCPVCGRNLFRGSSGSKIDAYCPKCKKLLKISFLGDGVTVKVDARERTYRGLLIKE
ncbi:MAG: hypothetical protein ACLSVG_00890 [Clostridia bacterium]